MQLDGRRLGERYEITGRVGGGGMATVYKAKDILLHRFVAIKVLSESLSNDSEFVRRFSREAQAAASLSHPNIVNVYDVGQDGYLHYIVMELVEGHTLKQYIQEKGALSATEAANIALQICDGLSHAHENQIVHRDIKPHNILVDKSGRAKVTDFGIARAANSSTITQTGSVMGSVHYFSPEQARGGTIREKADIYSLGVVMYEMVTGELPFDGDSAISIALKHLQEPVVDPREYNSQIPDNIVKIILRSMEKDPDMRYTSTQAMMQDITYALKLNEQSESQWMNHGRSTQTQDLFQTIPISDEDTEIQSNIYHEKVNDRVASTHHQSPIQRPEIRLGQNHSTSTSNQQVGENTMTHLRRFKNVSNDKDKTVFQRTVVWLENVQAKLPWWQKILFGFLTVVVIIGIAIFGFNLFWNLISGDNSAENPNHNPQNQQAIENQNSGDNDTNQDDPDDGEMVQVQDYTGMWQSAAETIAASSEQKLGYKINISNSRCYHQNTTGQSLQSGQILESYPQAGEKIKQGGTVYLWIYVPKSACNTIPPSMGGEAG